METGQRNPSFCRSIVSGSLRQDLIFPYPKIDDLEEEALMLLLERLKSFAIEKVDSVKIETEGGISQEVLDGLADLCLYGMTTTKREGGHGFSTMAYNRVFEEICKIDPSLATMMGAHQSIGMKAIQLFGTNEQRAKYLPKLATGEWIAAFALTEPDAGSDAAGIKTRAVPAPDGSYYVLNGNKRWITNGGLAHVFTVFAKTPTAEDTDKISAFIITRDMPGFASGKEEQKLGLCGSSTTTLSFDNIHVPKGHLIGKPGIGFKIAMEVLNSGRLSLSAGNLGSTKQLISLAAKYSKARKQFNAPIADFKMIQSKISEMVIDAYVLESMVYLTSGLADREDVDFSLESAACKIYGAETVWRAANNAMQIAGGIGYSKEYPYERILRDARICQIIEGTNEILRTYIALSGMQEHGEYLKTIGKALKHPMSDLSLLGEYALHKVKHVVMTDRLSHVNDLLGREVRLFEESAKDLHLKVERLLIEYKKDIINQGFHLERLANMMIDLFAMAATLSRADSSLKEVGSERLEQEIDIVKSFCESASARIRRNGKQLENNNDYLTEKIASDACNDGGYLLNLVM